ncbi:hypothetical protein V7114_20520 [Neobacillus niacini]|uniref:hypothetical protein n=1 Tax=Neobacillus niacini TaxID=86668 RepID=UPI002FFFB34F
MELQSVFYKLRSDVFLVEVNEDESYGFNEISWNQFLNRYGTNPKPDGKRLSGSDSVDKEAFYRFVEERKVLKRWNVEAADLMQKLSNAMSDRSVSPYKEEYISDVARRVHDTEEVLLELKQFLRKAGY